MKKLISMMLLLLCVAVTRAELQQINGVYQISTAEDLAEFGAKIPTTPQMNAVLLADITYSGAPLGGDKAFHGVFDGQGHSITLNQTRDAQGGGLFWSAEVPCVVKNLTVKGTITTTKDKCGAFGFYGSGAFINCVADVTINSTYDGDASHGGFVANGYDNTRIVNCVSATKINGGGKSKNAGGFIGWNNNPKCQIVNSICVAEISDMVGTGSNSIARHAAGNTPTMTNVYFLNKLDVADGNAQQTTAAALTDGSLLANLNGFDATMKWTQGDGYPVPVPSSDVYVITTPQDLVNFTAHVNKGNVGLSARVEADLDMNGIAATPIGNDIWNYRATFDGQGHTISNLHIDCASPAGLFGTIAGNARISNLVLDATCSITSTGYAGIIGHSTGAEKVWLTGLGNLGTVTSTGKGVGGIIGNCNSGSVLVADMCWSAGAISGAGDAAAICGWTNAAGSSITNCWSISEVTGNDGAAKIFYRYGTAPTNQGNYCTSGTQVSKIELDDVKSGKFCYVNLNGESSENPKWFQKLDGSSLPTLFGSDIVYCSGEFYCDGTSKGTVNYNNVSGSSQRDPHTLVDGICSKCNNPDKDGDYYLIPSGRALRWFSMHVQTTPSANAKLTADIDLSGDNFEPIGTQDVAYAGTFDGQGHKISNAKIHIESEDATNSVAGFFGLANGAQLKNFWLDETCSVTGCVKAMGGICGRTNNGALNFYNVGFAGTVNNTATFQDAGTAGILGQANGSRADMDYCWVAGSITGQKDVAALSAWEGNNNAVIQNCWAVAELNKYQDAAHYLARSGSSFTIRNCYANVGTQGVRNDITSEMIPTGELAYIMGANWGQAIDSDEYPVLNAQKVLYVGDLGYSTLFTTEACELKGDATANKVSVSGDEAVLTEVANIPANNAVVLEGTYYNKVACANADADMTGNLLKGSATELSADAMAEANPNCLFYALSVKQGEEKTKENAGFYWLAEDGGAFTSKAGKGYLALPKNQANNIRGFRFGESGEATGIESLKKEDTISGAIYNLQGQRVGANAKGIVIMNGKKVIK